jgi:hypothetical protein
MSKDRILWEDIPDDILSKWLRDYKLETWPFKAKTRHDGNREKVQKLYFDIHSAGSAHRRKSPRQAGRGRLPKDANLKILYDLLSEARCAVFDDEKMKRTINNKATAEFKTCEIVVRDLNRFIRTL